jgi:hypothetical protein
MGFNIPEQSMATKPRRQMKMNEGEDILKADFCKVCLFLTESVAGQLPKVLIKGILLSRTRMSRTT